MYDLLLLISYLIVCLLEQINIYLFSIFKKDIKGKKKKAIYIMPELGKQRNKGYYTTKYNYLGKIIEV